MLKFVNGLFLQEKQIVKNIGLAKINKGYINIGNGNSKRNYLFVAKLDEDNTKKFCK